MSDNTDNKDNFFVRTNEKIQQTIDYLVSGVWRDPRRNWRTNIIRTLNLSVNSFMNRDIQSQACAMTYRTMLAIVPVLALLIAIGRGFNIQAVLMNELYSIFPAQKPAIELASGFVDSYLAQMSGGIFLGIGIVFLLWTLISLLSNVEDTFNLIWGQKSGRSIWRKITDYTALMLILPILMLCSSGITLLLSSTLKSFFDFEFMTPVIAWLLEGLKCLATFLFFTAAYMLIPNVKVKFRSAFISGCIAGVAFLILQWLFVTGTLYVTRYNAIYGSFAFIPLLLLWMQLAWMICLAGAVICYSSQNFFAFNLASEVGSISTRYRDMVTIAITAVITRRFIDNEEPLTEHDIMHIYDVPARLVTNITERLCLAGVCSRVLVEDDERTDDVAYQLALDPSTLTIKVLQDKLYSLGANDFIRGFDDRFPKILNLFEHLHNAYDSIAGNELVGNLYFEKDAKTTTNKS